MDQQPYAPPTTAALHTPDGLAHYAVPQQPAPLAAYRPAPYSAVPVQVIDPTAIHLPVPAPAGQGRDVWPARLLTGGIGIGAAGAGLGFLLQTLAAATTGLGLLAVVLALVWLLKNSSSSGRGGGAVNVQVNVTNRNR